MVLDDKTIMTPAQRVSIVRVDNGFMITASLNDGTQDIFVVEDSTGDGLESLQDASLYVISKFISYLNSPPNESLTTIKIHLGEVPDFRVDEDKLDGGGNGSLEDTSGDEWKDQTPN